MSYKFIFSLLFAFLTFYGVDAQVCDDLVANGCEFTVSGGWSKISSCGSGSVNIQYCHPKFYVGSGHNLTIVGSKNGKIIFDELLKKTTLSSGLTVRKAVGKNSNGKFFTGIFTYNDDDKISSCYIKPGADRSGNISLPR